MRARFIVVASALMSVVALLTGAGPTGRTGQTAAEPAVTLRVIVLTTQESADLVLDQLRKGGSFALMARTASTAPSAADGGWLGKLPIAQLRPEVRAAIQGLRPGQLTPVMRLPTGFAIFKVEDDDPAEALAEGVSAAIAATGAVKFVYDLSGFTEARAAIESSEKPSGWSESPRTICEMRTKSIASVRSSIEAALAPGGAASSRPAVDVMQLHVLLAQLDAYEGRLGGTIARLEQARGVAETEGPAAVLPLEQGLGIAHLHKAEIDNHVQTAPGEYCLLGLRPVTLKQTADADAAFARFASYLGARPNDLEVRWWLNRAAMATGRYPDKVPASQLIPPSAFTSAEDVGRFRDVAPQAGLASLSSAGGVIVGDFRGTGRFDVVSSTMDSCGAMRMHVNNGDGTFTDHTAASGLSGQLGGLNLISGDYNNDGCLDILVLRGGWESLPQRLSLLRNDCRGNFTDVTVASGLTALVTTQTGVWADIDNDGWLDLFVGNETGPAQLYRNKGNGTFENISRAAGVDRTSFVKGVAAADYDNDRYPDLYVSNYGGSNFLYHNNRNGTFTEVSSAARVRGTVMGFGTWFFDYNNDGLSDLFVTSYVSSVDEIVRDYLGQPHNATTMRLYRNLGDGTFRDVSKEAALDAVQMPMGSNFGDIDNDGWLDMYLGTGQPSYAATVGSMLLRNRGGRSFVNVTASSGTGELHKGHGVAFADLDHDGDEDIVFEVGGATPGDRHAMRVFENPGHGNDWLALKLVGVKTNRSAVGARITVTVEDAAGTTRLIHRTVGTGGSFGASPLVQHIGLGKAAKIASLEIWWPTSDLRQRFTDVAKNQWLQVEELADRYTVLKRDQAMLGGARREP